MIATVSGVRTTVQASFVADHRLTIIIRARAIELKTGCPVKVVTVRSREA